MNFDFETIQPDEFGTYVIAYQSVLLGQEVELRVPSDHGRLFDWQIEVLNQYCQMEARLKETVYDSILGYYLEQLPDLREQFGDQADIRAPLIENASQLTQLITPTGICIGELEPSEEAVGLLFECVWEPEHGLGVLLMNWSVAEVGHQDVAFTI
ncbi:MAG: hypothetical protein VYA55_19065 [Pseudomonadota bacterium]|nr:hypothetical protein [Pseudomonadota bacterium]